MNQYCKNYKLPKLIQEETDSLSSPITIKEIEFAFKNFLKKKYPGPDGFTCKFYQTFKEEEIIPILHIPFQKNKRENAF